MQTEGTGDTVAVDTFLATNGGDVAISADTITVGANDGIYTVLSGGASGNISLSGKAISLEGAPGGAASLFANAAGVGGTGGDVTLSVSDTAIRAVQLPLNFTHKIVSVSLEDALIEGANVTIDANASDTMLTSQQAALAEGFVGALDQLLNSIPGALIGAFSGIDASVIERGADATVQVDNSQIDSAGTVTIDSVTVAQASVSAIALGYNPATGTSPPIDAAAGYGFAGSTVSAEITGASTIAAGGDVNITADGTRLGCRRCDRVGKSDRGHQSQRDVNLGRDRRCAANGHGDRRHRREGDVHDRQREHHRDRDDGRDASGIDGHRQIRPGGRFRGAGVRNRQRGRHDRRHGDRRRNVTQANTFNGGSAAPSTRPTERSISPATASRPARRSFTTRVSNRSPG